MSMIQRAQHRACLVSLFAPGHELGYALAASPVTAQR